MKKTMQGMALALCATGVAGATDYFTGPAVSLGPTYVHNITSAHSSNALQIGAGAPVDTNYVLNLVKNNRLVPTVALTYGFAMPQDSRVTLALSGAWDMGWYNQRFASAAHDYLRGQQAPGRASGDVRNYISETVVNGRQHASVSLEPGYAFTDTTVGFMRLSYHVLRAGLKSTSSYDLVTDPHEVLDPSSKANFQGAGLGLGVKQKLSKHWYMSADVEGVYYQSVKRPGSTLTVDVGGGNTLISNIQEIRPQVVATRLMVGYQF